MLKRIETDDEGSGNRLNYVTNWIVNELIKKPSQVVKNNKKSISMTKNTLINILLDY